MKKLVVSFVLLLVLFQVFSYQIAFAQENEPPIPPVPTNGNVVLDTLDWLTPDQEAEINAVNKKLDEEGLAQMAVVTLDDCGTDKPKFRNELFNTWGIGHADDNDGLLILVCWYAGDPSRRSLEQETGYGLESTVPDALTASVAKENFIPAFQAEHPGSGLVQMVVVYDRLLRHLSTPQPDPFVPSSTLPQSISVNDLPANPSQQSPGPSNEMLVFLGGLGFVILLVIIFLVGRIYTMDTTQRSRREEQREKSERRRLVLTIASLVAFAVTVFLAFIVNITGAFIFASISALILAIAAAAPAGGNGGDTGSDWGSDWHPRSGGSSGGSGDGGGGSFGGGSSGGGGSSTGF